MQIDFSHVDDIDSYVSIPEGSYVCRIAEVREGVTREGSPRWAYRLEVTAGDYAGRTAAWDALIWSERALPRVKQILARLGFDVSGSLEVQPNDLVGRSIKAQFMIEEREDPLTGRHIARLRVPYMGYEAIAADEGPF